MDQNITKSTGWTIGLDLGDRFVEGCVVDEAGETVERFRARTRRNDLEKRLGAYASSRVVLEVGTHSPWISRVATACGHETIVANPRRVRLIAQNDSKSDSVDAELLARLARIDPNLLKPDPLCSEDNYVTLVMAKRRWRRAYAPMRWSGRGPRREAHTQETKPLIERLSADILPPRTV
jgi:hypothetical protein